jgi:Rad3-related DNA helicase
MYINKDKFPFKEIRPQQLSAIEQINKENKKYNILGLSTGVGKSPLAVAACQSYPKGMILTLTKSLQNQYENDFGHLSLINMKGKANYPCNFNDQLNCEIGPCIASKKIMQNCRENNLCVYYNLKEKALKANIFLTSYAFCMRAAACAPWFMNQKRNLMVFDEAHCIEEQFITFAEFTIDIEHLLGKYFFVNEITQELADLQDTLPTEKTPIKEIKDWIVKVFDEIIAKKYEEGKDKLEEILSDTSLPNSAVAEAVKLHKQHYQLDKLYQKISNFITHINRYWIFEFKDKTIHATPIEVDWIFEQYIAPLADNFIFMSATILDKHIFCKSLGIPEDETAFILEDSPFDPKKSPIYIAPICETNYHALQQKVNLDNIVKGIKLILSKHPNEKGLIHAGNFTLIKYIKDHLKDNRLLFRYENDTNEVILQKHIAQKNKPTVLVSSSLEEGADLKDDLSRFMVIIKAPFLSLSSKRVSILANIAGDWYFYMMICSLLQMCGRSTRSENDYAKTYILDSKFWAWFYKAKEKNWLPQQFQKRITKL